MEGYVRESRLFDTVGEVERVHFGAPASDARQTSSFGRPELDGDLRSQTGEYALDGGLFTERHLRGLLEERV
jgi:hypothetical protein